VVTLIGGDGKDRIVGSAGKITGFQFGKPKTNQDGDMVIADGVLVT
jgi:hypothetical protein